MQSLIKIFMFLTLFICSIYAGVNYRVEYGELNKEDHFVSKVDKKLFGNSNTLDAIFNETDVFYSIINSNNEIIYTTNIARAGSQEARKVIKTSDGGYLVAGFSGIQSNEKISAMMMKFDSMMNLVWVKEYSDKNTNNSMAYDVVEHENGYIFSGYYINDDATYSVWVIKTDTNGAILWEYKRLANASADTKLAVDSANNIYVLAKTNRPSYGLYDIELIKLNSNGSEQWVTELGGNTADRVAKLFVDEESSRIISITGDFDRLQYSDIAMDDGTINSSKYFDGGWSSYAADTAVRDGNVIFIGGEKDFTTSYPSAFIKAIDLNGNELGDKTLINSNYITHINEMYYFNNSITIMGSRVVNVNKHNAVMANIDFIKPKVVIKKPSEESIIKEPTIILTSEADSLILNQSMTLTAKVDKIVDNYTWYINGVSELGGSNYIYNSNQAGDINITVSISDTDGMEVNSTKIINVREASVPVTSHTKSFTKNILQLVQKSIVADGTIIDEAISINGVNTNTYIFTYCNEDINIALSAKSSFEKTDTYNENYTFVCSDLNLEANVSSVAGEVGVPIHFTSNDVSPNTTENISLEWFVNGDIITGANINYTFEKTGIYNVVVRGTDALGAVATDNFTITINDAMVEKKNEQPTQDVPVIGKDILKKIFIFELKTGWNLISSPIVSDINVSDFNATKAFGFENGSWVTNPLTIKQGKGMWIKVNKDVNLSVIGKPYEFTPSKLSKGWNLLGGGDTKVHSVKVFTYDSGKGFHRSKSVEATKGFWMYQE